MRYIQFIPLVFFAVLMMSTVARADFELGVKYYESKDFENAYKEFLSAAEQGDNDAQQNIGAMYYRGEFVSKDVVSAYAWMALAAQRKEILDEGVHFKIYKKMNDTEKHLAEEKHQTLLDKFGSGAIEKKLLPLFTGTKLNVQSQRIIKSSVLSYPQIELRNGNAGYVEFVYTIDKHGLTRDFVIVYGTSKYFEKAAIETLRKFQYEPPTVNGKPVDINGIKTRFKFEIHGNTYNNKKITKIINEMREKAKAGTAKDKLGFAYFIEILPSFAKDYQLIDNPNEWYVNAANQGNNMASYFLGRNILYGNMCTQDTNQSMIWLSKAAKDGLADAQYMLAIESFSGARVEKNEEKAFFWLERAANKLDAAKVRFAWLLSTHPDSKRRDGKRAISKISELASDYIDLQNYYQAYAAAEAENGNFDSAIKWQNMAIEDAKLLEIPLELLQQRLVKYLGKQPWREEI